MNILFAGETAGGSANYLIGLLNAAGARFIHIPSAQKLDRARLQGKFDAFILSDFPSKNIEPSALETLHSQLAGGAGLLMVGGWGSFAGPFGNWQRSTFAKYLPVKCRTRDDRVNLQQGAFIQKSGRHFLTDGLPWRAPPIICGLNQLEALPESRVLLTAHPVQAKAGQSIDLRRAEKSYPLLVVSERGGLRRAALATDVAPHWCGGWVDWGARRVILKVDARNRCEVGSAYARFGASLIRWIAGK